MKTTIPKKATHRIKLMGFKRACRLLYGSCSVVDYAVYGIGKQFWNRMLRQQQRSQLYANISDGFTPQAFCQTKEHGRLQNGWITFCVPLNLIRYQEKLNKENV